MVYVILHFKNLCGLKLIRDIRELQLLQNSIVTTGTFDGVHRGHQRIFDHMKLKSAKTGQPTVVVTFHPHPRIVLKKEPEKLQLLSTIDEKIKLIEKTGIDYLLILEFNAELASLKPEEFICQILISKLNAKTVFVGYDHQFGKNQSGNKHTLKEVSCRHKLEVIEVSALEDKGEIVSSSIIRHLLENGKVGEAAKKLGYNYQLSGKVVKGNMLGRKIGFPTANIELTEKLKLIPGRGVYAVRVLIGNTMHNGMLNIGKRPTINTDTATVEVHVFGFNANLYDEEITIEFIKFIRDEKKFPGLEELGRQLQQDRKHALQVLS